MHVDHPGEAEQHTSCPSRNATWRANPSVMSGSDLAPVWKSVSASRWADSKIASSSEAHPPAITKSTDFGGCVRAEEPTRPTGISCRKLGRMVQMPGPGSLKKPSAPLQIVQRRRQPRMRRCVYGPRYAVSSRGRLAFHASTERSLTSCGVLTRREYAPHASTQAPRSQARRGRAASPSAAAERTGLSPAAMRARPVRPCARGSAGLARKGPAGLSRVGSRVERGGVPTAGDARACARTRVSVHDVCVQVRACVCE